MSNPATKNTVAGPEIAPRLRHGLAERAKEIVEADHAAEATREKLRDELEEHNRLIAEANNELGAATLDDVDHRKAAKKLQTARDNANRVEAAIAEVDRREDEAWQEAWEAAVSAERLRGYRWMIDYLDHVAAYLRAQAAADEAADRLRNVGEVASIRNFQMGLWGLPSETLFDEELLGATSPRPLSAQEEQRRLGQSPFARLTVEECDRLREKALSLAAAEAEPQPNKGRARRLGA
jgi:hypothetical protein